MPASQVMKKFKKGKLRSGSKTGHVVTDPKQAKAIQLSELRQEGHNIPPAPPKKLKAARAKRMGKYKL